MKLCFSTITRLFSDRFVDEFRLAAMGESRLLKCFERHVEITPPEPEPKKNILDYQSIVVDINAVEIKETIIDTLTADTLEENNTPSSAPRELFMLKLNIDGDIFDNVAVYESDTAVVVAERFCTKHGISREDEEADGLEEYINEEMEKEMKSRKTAESPISRSLMALEGDMLSGFGMMDYEEKGNREEGKEAGGCCVIQ